MLRDHRQQIRDAMGDTQQPDFVFNMAIVRRPSGMLRPFKTTSPAYANAAKTIENGLRLAEFGRARR